MKNLHNININDLTKDELRRIAVHFSIRGYRRFEISTKMGRIDSTGKPVNTIYMFDGTSSSAHDGEICSLSHVGEISIIGLNNLKSKITYSRVSK